MVTRDSVSYDRLIHELNEHGRFTRNVPTAGVSIEVLQALDYLYYELLDLDKRDQFTKSGLLIDVSFDRDRIHVRSFHKSGSIHVKSFGMSHEDIMVYEFLLQMIPNTYSSLKIAKQHTFYVEKTRNSTYLIEYNHSQEEEHSP